MIDFLLYTPIRDLLVIAAFICAVLGCACLVAHAILLRGGR